MTPEEKAEMRKLSEEDVKLRYITPAIEQAGWAKDRIRMEYPFTAGRVIFEGNVHARQSSLRADYLLFDRNNYPIAVVEAKDNTKPMGGGMQQAINYAEIQWSLTPVPHSAHHKQKQTWHTFAPTMTTLRMTSNKTIS